MRAIYQMLAAFSIATIFCGCEVVDSSTGGYSYGPGSVQQSSVASYSSGAFTYGPGAASGSSDAQADYNRALADYNDALRAYNGASTVGGIENANWAIQQSSAPGMGKGLAFLGMVAGNASRDDAARQVEVARQRLEAARQRLVAQSVSVQVAAPSKGRVSIVAVPDSADVSVDGSAVGNSPCTLSLPEGVHEFQISASGYKSSSRSIAVVPDSDMTLRVTLDKNE